MRERERRGREGLSERVREKITGGEGVRDRVRENTEEERE